MSAKTTYTATTPDGTYSRQRTSARAYTHACWVEWPADDSTPGQRIISFHSSLEAALKTSGGQSAAMTAYIRSLPHGVVEVTV